MSSTSGLALDARYAFVSDDKGMVYALDRSSGNSVWRQDKLSLRNLSAPLALGQEIVGRRHSGLCAFSGRATPAPSSAGWRPTAARSAPIRSACPTAAFWYRPATAGCMPSAPNRKSNQRAERRLRPAEEMFDLIPGRRALALDPAHHETHSSHRRPAQRRQVHAVQPAHAQPRRARGRHARPDARSPLRRGARRRQAVLRGGHRRLRAGGERRHPARDGEADPAGHRRGRRDPVHGRRAPGARRAGPQHRRHAAQDRAAGVAHREQGRRHECRRGHRRISRTRAGRSRMRSPPRTAKASATWSIWHSPDSSAEPDEEHGAGPSAHRHHRPPQRRQVDPDQRPAGREPRHRLRPARHHARQHRGPVRARRQALHADRHRRACAAAGRCSRRWRSFP